MSNLKEIMAISEQDLDLVVFSNPKQDAGINTIYCPVADKEVYQVFIHQKFPMIEVQSWEFENFRDARNFAASHFKNWEMLHWNHGVNRPCGKGDDCGKGSCSTKKNPDGTSAGGCGTGGCSSCGATKEFDEMLAE